MSIKRKIFTMLYYGFARYLPDPYTPVVGKACNAVRVFCVKRIFRKCGKIQTVCRGVYFGSGAEVEIGDYSGLGPNCRITPDIKIGNYVMMAPDLLVLRANHRFDDPDTPIGLQGVEPAPPCVIGDNVWIGQRVTIVPGRRIASGTVVAACAVVTKDFPENMIIGGNPARVIRPRCSAKSGLPQTQQS